MQNIKKFWQGFRDSRDGFYCDNISLQNTQVCGAGNRFFSAATTGWGLIANAIFAALGLMTVDEAKTMTKQGRIFFSSR